MTAATRKNKMVKKYYVIKNVFGHLITKSDGSFLVFEYPIQASKYIDKHFGGTNSLRIVKLKQ